MSKANRNIDLNAVRRAEEVVRERFGVSLDDLRDRSRHPIKYAARLVAASVMREHNMSFPAIGYVIDRDHSTIMHNLQYGGV